MNGNIVGAVVLIALLIIGSIANWREYARVEKAFQALPKWRIEQNPVTGKFRVQQKWSVRPEAPDDYYYHPLGFAGSYQTLSAAQDAIDRDEAEDMALDGWNHAAVYSYPEGRLQ